MPKAKVESSKIGAIQRQIKNINKKAMRAGAKLVVANVKSAAPSVSGALRQSIASKVDSVKNDTTAYAIVGPRSKFSKVYKGAVHRPSRYAHFLEWGKFAKPFLLPSFQANRDNYLQAIEKVYATELQKVING